MRPRGWRVLIGSARTAASYCKRVSAPPGPFNRRSDGATSFIITTSYTYYRARGRTRDYGWATARPISPDYQFDTNGSAYDSARDRFLGTRAA